MIQMLDIIDNVYSMIIANKTVELIQYQYGWGYQDGLKVIFFEDLVTFMHWYCEERGLWLKV